MDDLFHEIVDTADPLLDRFWFPLYRRAFPADERVDETEHLTATATPDQHLLVSLSEGQPVAMARYDVVVAARPCSYGYLMYMAVDERTVSRGHGRQMFGEIVQRLGRHPAAPSLLLLEVEHPRHRHSTEPHQSPARRIDFYRRLGGSCP